MSILNVFVQLAAALPAVTGPFQLAGLAMFLVALFVAVALTRRS